MTLIYLKMTPRSFSNYSWQRIFSIAAALASEGSVHHHTVSYRIPGQKTTLGTNFCLRELPGVGTRVALE